MKIPILEVRELRRYFPVRTGIFLKKSGDVRAVDGVSLKVHRGETVGLVGEDTSYQAAFNYTGDLYRFQVDHLLVGKNFNPEIGFLRRDDFRRTFGQAQYRPRPSMNAVRQFTFGASLDYIETVAGTLETRIAQGRFDVEFENSDSFNFDVQKNFERLTVPFRIASEVTVPVGAYNFNDYFMS